jgi:hypothetical protein
MPDDDRMLFLVERIKTMTGPDAAQLALDAGLLDMHQKISGHGFAFAPAKVKVEGEDWRCLVGARKLNGEVDWRVYGIPQEATPQEAHFLFVAIVEQVQEKLGRVPRLETIDTKAQSNN